MSADKLRVHRNVQDVLGWPTDTFAIDWCHDDRAPTEHKKRQSAVHTAILFVPGNPGLAEWYISFFEQILENLGPGFAVRGASNAGHSVDPRQINVEAEAVPANHSTTSSAEEATAVPPQTMARTIDGQVHHKLAYIDGVIQDLQARAARVSPPLKLIFVGHSIGCHFTQRILLLRLDLLERTTRCIFLMPFIRMDAPAPHQKFLDWAAMHPKFSNRLLQRLSRLLALFPLRIVERLLTSLMDKEEDCQFTAQLLRQPIFPRNFLGLGLEEILEVPQAADVSLGCVPY